mmetsp:Transcript_50826/g.108855  ORF Transcript_50826/g.108855 Transcript_50826/m.108855 type:complete len:266 (+) Transcript_50826:263-1060(+)
MTAALNMNMSLYVVGTLVRRMELPLLLSAVGTSASASLSFTSDAAADGFAEEEEEEEEESEADRAMQVLSKMYKKPKTREALDKMVKELNAKGNVYELFQRFDANNDKTLSREEMQVGLRSIGCSLLPVELDAVIRAFDSDGNGTVDYPEFYSILKFHQANMPYQEPIDEGEQFCGYNVGDLVKSLVKAKAGTGDVKTAEYEVGKVMGAGASPGTVLVYFEKSGTRVSMKSTQIIRYEPKSASKEKSVQRSKSFSTSGMRSQTIA